jgi:hypothetical protein
MNKACMNVNPQHLPPPLKKHLISYIKMLETFRIFIIITPMIQVAMQITNLMINKDALGLEFSK